MAYIVEKKIFSDALSDTYDVVDEHSRIHYNMTEFYLDGITSQITQEAAEQKYLNLYRSLWAMKNISLAYLPKITHVEATSKITVIWENLYGLSLKNYIESYKARISYQALLNVLPPLLNDCETAHQNGLYFTVSPETIFLTDGGNLKLNTLVNPSANIYTVNRDIAQSIFFMLTGLPYGNVQIPIDIYIPAPLWQLLYDVLSWRCEFGSVGEFHNAIRLAVRASENEGLTADYTSIRGKRKKHSGTMAAAGIGIGCFSIIVLVLVFVIMGTVRYSSRVTAGQPPAVPSAETPGGYTENTVPFQSLSFDNVYYNPNNTNEIFDGMVLQTDAGLFYRRMSGNTGQLVEEVSSRQTVLVNGVFPSFLQSDGENVYFCDGYEGYHIYGFDGKACRLLVNKTSGYLCLYKNYLYYINDEDSGSLYRLNLVTNEGIKINDEACYDLTIIGTNLYYINIYDDYSIYRLDLENTDPSEAPLQLTGQDRVYGYELKNLKGNLMYYRQSDWQLCVITSDQTETPFIYPVSAYMYDICGNTLYYLDDADYVLHELLITQGGKDTVISSEECSYVTAVDDGVFFISDPSNYTLCRLRNNKRETVDIVKP